MRWASRFFLLSRLHNCLCRVAVGEYAMNGKALQFGFKRLVPVLLRSPDDLGKQIPVSQFRAALGHTGDIALRRHDVQHKDLRTEMVGQYRSLMNQRQRGIWEINRKKNLLNIQHRAPTRESKSP
jgi:hypothetical protein